MRPALLVVFIDALGPEQVPLLVDAGLALPHQHTLRGILGYSSGAIPTILTGAPPCEHGRMCLFSRVPHDHAGPLAPLRWMGLLPRIVHERGRVRRFAAQAIAAARGYDGYLALHRVPPEIFERLDIPEKENLFEAKDVGGAPTFLAQAREAGLRVVATDWRLPEHRRVEQIESMAKADLAFLYLAGLDAILHHDGRASRDARAWATKAVRWIDRAAAALGRGGREVRTLVVGDHGMAEVTRLVDPRAVTRRIERKLGKGFIFVDATMFRVGGTPEALEHARRELRSLPGRTLDAGDLEQRQAPHDGSYGDLIHVLPEGMLFAPSFLGGAVRGMHGYDRDQPSARAAVLSDAPIAEKLHGLEDVASWVMEALELEPAGAKKL